MNWLKAIAEADSHEELVAVVNDFLTHQVDEFWACIPLGLRPSLVASGSEIHDWHHRLADELARIEAPNIRLQDLCVVFVRASAREHEIASATKDGASSNDIAYSGAAACRRGPPTRP